MWEAASPTEQGMPPTLHTQEGKTKNKYKMKKSCPEKPKFLHPPRWYFGFVSHFIQSCPKLS